MAKLSENSGATVVFFGSGPVAAESLKLLTKSFTIEAVITKPKPAHHRGNFPVIDTAAELDLPIYTVSNKAELSTLISDDPFKSKLGVLIDFGIIVSQDVIDYFPFGIVNSHFSMLPEWRGADPISFAILSGQVTTGVSLMLLTAGMDEGPILGYGEYEIPANATTPELTEDLIHLSDSLLQALLPTYIAGESQLLSQEEAAEFQGKTHKPTYSQKLRKQDGTIDWNKPAEVIEREIRAYIEWPKSTAQLAGKDVVITNAHVIDKDGTPGTIDISDKQLVIYCGEKALAIGTLKPAGKKEMQVAAFLAGYGHLLLDN